MSLSAKELRCQPFVVRLRLLFKPAIQCGELKKRSARGRVPNRLSNQKQELQPNKKLHRQSSLESTLVYIRLSRLPNDHQDDFPYFGKNSSMTTYLCIKCKSRSNRGSTRGIKDRETFAQGEAMRKGVTSDARCVTSLAKRKALKQIKYRKERRQRQSGKWRKLTGERRERGRDLRRASRFIIKKRDECAECRIIH